ncbi:hypothetical protein LY76DRAFT_613057 [Colletotrichum caudatum]|nr:hypothetical protein LY76DRAFT_613057 [Colletotrichum caudatum]
MLRKIFVDTSPAGLKFHIIEPFPDTTSPSHLPPLVLLVHGFPNLSYDWRFMMPKLAEAGYYAVAFDMRGFGRTHNADLCPISESSFRPMTALRDVVTLVRALGYETVQHPGEEVTWPVPNIRSSLLKLDPPRKHCKYCNASPGAAEEWTRPTGEPMHRFLRGYFHLKSAAYSLNKPRPLASWTAEQLALSMRENVDLDMLGGDTRWLTDADLQVYTDEFPRNTFGPSLLWYKVLAGPGLSADLLCFAGTKIGVPTKYVSGTSDWGTYQKPEESVKEILGLARSV